jgi:hypothetical protein
MSQILANSPVLLRNIRNFLFILKIVEKTADSQSSLRVNIIEEKLIAYFLRSNNDPKFIQLQTVVDLMGNADDFLFIFELREVEMEESQGFDGVLQQNYLKKYIECVFCILCVLSKVINVEREDDNYTHQSHNVLLYLRF